MRNCKEIHLNCSFDEMSGCEILYTQFQVLVQEIYQGSSDLSQQEGNLKVHVDNEASFGSSL